MLTLNPKELAIPVLHKYLQNAVAPRPICFASTVNKAGEPNLAPFSFFNIFSANPPIAVFSPAYSGRTGAPKDTLLNVKEVPEVVINVVNYNMVQQTSLASSPFAKGVNEFIKAGFTPVVSELVKPFRVKESPVQMECKVIEIKELGTAGGAGNLVICEIIRIHIDESILNAENNIDTKKIDLVARMGDDWYCRANGNAIFEVKKPITTIGIGIDQIPSEIKNSKVLSGNNLGLLGSVEEIPNSNETAEYKKTLKAFSNKDEQHLYAKTLLETNMVKEAWMVLL
ncbi:flavin reductase family protein [Aurantibacillus circumpalustris]|uniref:flavin reductase family protein n=1 Tax=Aurantibacillus circumpalustris TaxID=3036359 RepID=UPI00295BBFC2|nr:flavin reductase family protein [Aurantibacillus circumpalustris]